MGPFLLIDAQVNQSQDDLVAHESLEQLLPLAALLAVRQHILPQLRVPHVPEALCKLAKALPGLKQFAEILPRIAGRPGHVIVVVGKLLFAVFAGDAEAVVAAILEGLHLRRSIFNDKNSSADKKRSIT